MSRSDIRWWFTDVGAGEIEAVTSAIRDRHVHHGPEAAALEGELAAFLAVEHVIATTSGSVALMLALKALGIGAGDEVIVPAATFIAPAHAAMFLGAQVVLADVEADRPVISPEEVQRVLTPRTRAIICAHLNGRAADIAAIAAIAGPRVAIVEDSAQAFASRRGAHYLGTRGTVGAFSLGITKLITTGEGGFLATADADLATRLTKLRNHGVLRIADNVFPELGCNFRMTDLQAAVGRAQLRRVQEKIQAVRRTYDFYASGLAELPGIRLLPVDLDAGEVPLWVEAVCTQRDEVIEQLAARGIESKAFHPCLARSPHLSAVGEFPNAERFAAEVLTLPCGPDQPRAHLERTVAALREIAGGRS